MQPLPIPTSISTLDLVAMRNTPKKKKKETRKTPPLLLHNTLASVWLPCPALLTRLEEAQRIARLTTRTY
jgi:hypothetical protein